jgi:hypothetical protein
VRAHTGHEDFDELWVFRCFYYFAIYQKGAYYSGIKIFNNLPLEIKNVSDNPKKFKIALKKFLYTYSFYTMEEYLSQLWIKYCITRSLL